MGFFIIPLGTVSRLFHRTAVKVFGKEEVEDLRSDLVVPVTEFVDEVYDDCVGDAVKRLTGNTQKSDRCQSDLQLM